MSHAHRGREMIDDVSAIDQFGDERLVHHRIDDVFESLAALEVDDVVHRSRRQIVHDENAVALREKRLGQMRSDEPRAAGEKGLHDRTPVRWNRETGHQQ